MGRNKRMGTSKPSSSRRARSASFSEKLERKVQVLQAIADDMEEKLATYMTENNELTAHNNELKRIWQMLEEEFEENTAINEELEEEIERLKLSIAETEIRNGIYFIPSPTSEDEQEAKSSP